MCGELMFPNWKCPGFHHRLLHVWAVDREAHHMMDLLNQVMRQVLVQCRYAHHLGYGSFGALVSSYLSTSIYLWGGCFYWLVFPHDHHLGNVAAISEHTQSPTSFAC